MRRHRFYSPARSQSVTVDIVWTMLRLVDVQCLPAELEPLTYIERVVAYDWAMRHHLHASDNPVHLRPRPRFLAGFKGGPRTP